MLALLPILCLIMVFLIFSLRRPSFTGVPLDESEPDWRHAALVSGVVTASFAILLTNLLSPINLVRVGVLIGAWVIAFLAAAVMFWQLRARGWRLYFGFARLSIFPYVLSAGNHIPWHFAMRDWIHRSPQQLGFAGLSHASHHALAPAA